MKNNNPYNSGIPDVWYSADLSDMWVEYKFLPSVPQRGIVDAKRVGLSALQSAWLAGRHKEHRNVAVIVGVPGGGMRARIGTYGTAVLFEGRKMARHVHCRVGPDGA